MTTVPQLAEAAQTLLTTTAEATARATGFVQRRCLRVVGGDYG